RRRSNHSYHDRQHPAERAGVPANRGGRQPAAGRLHSGDAGGARYRAGQPAKRRPGAATRKGRPQPHGIGPTTPEGRREVSVLGRVTLLKDIRQKLLATFQIEHHDHLEHIRSLVAMIVKTSAPRAGPELEEAFRRAHSLKGAARAVDLRSVEGLA